MPGSPLLLAALIAASIVLAGVGIRLIVVPSADLSLPLRGDQGVQSSRQTVGRLIDRIGRPVAPVLAFLVRGRRRTALRARLCAAGRSDQTTVDAFAARRAGLVLLGAISGVYYVVDGHPFVGLSLAATIGGSADLTLVLQARGRQEEIEVQLPDLLDALTVALLAGSAFRPALERLSRLYNGALAEELGLTLRQLQMGTGRRSAFEQLRERNTAPGLRRFVGAVLQAEELGTSLSATLADLADQSRRKSGQTARRRADQIEKKVILINAALFLPAMVMMLLCVALLGFSAFGTAGGS